MNPNMNKTAEGNDPIGVGYGTENKALI